MPRNPTQEELQDVSTEMEQLGYNCTPELVQSVLDHQRAVPLPDNAALASNILIALSQRGVN